MRTPEQLRQQAEAMQVRRRANPEKYREISRRAGRKRWAEGKLLAWTYGISVPEVRQIQAASCGICGTKDRKIVIDHDHSTGKVRGGLCTSCNTKLGWYEKRRASIYAWLVKGA